MNDLFKVIVYGLAAVGGVVVGGVIMSKYLTVGIYSPYVPQYDLLKIRGSTLFKLISSGGGETTPQASSGMPFPIAVRVRWFDKSASVAEELYAQIAGKEFDTASFLKG